MAIGADSYSSVGEVEAMTRHLLDGKSAFDATTRPTLTEVEKFIDRCSGVLNTALAGGGFAIPITNATAKLACDEWVTTKAVAWVEYTQRSTGFDEGQTNRGSAFMNMYAAATAFVNDMMAGFKKLGVGVTDPTHQGLAFTGLTAVANRTDPTNTGLAQPRFTRSLFENTDAENND